MLRFPTVVLNDELYGPCDQTRTIPPVPPVSLTTTGVEPKGRS